MSMTKLPSIFELTEDTLEVLALLEREEEPEARAALAQWFGEIQTDMATKVDGIVWIHRNLKAVAAARREEVRHLTELARAAENAADHLKDKVLEACQALGVSRLEGKTRKITISSGGEAIEVTDLDVLPQEFVRIKKEPDKEAIAKAIKETGFLPPGVSVRPITTVRMS